MPAAMLHSGTTLLLLHALSHTSVTDVVVWRQLSPLPSMVVERFLTNAIYRTTFYAYFGLLLIPVGVAVYSCYDYLFNWLGTTFAVLSMLVMVWEGLLKRHLLTNQKEPLVLSLQAMVFINNGVGFCAGLVLVLSYELWLCGYRAIPHIGQNEVLFLFASAFLSGMYHYMGLQLARAVSAGLVLACTNTSKVAILVFAALCLGESTSALAGLGAGLAIGGNLIYMLARLHVMANQELLDTKNDETTGSHISAHIIAKADDLGYVDQTKFESWRSTLRDLMPSRGGGARAERESRGAQSQSSGGGGGE